ncbi:MAG TPA: ClpXP protease specificity-enhancing factor SspB [Beijerinckiaceae bacterium]|jgi:hypothetical protein
MSKDLIRYDLLVQDALKGVVRKVLGDAARDGLAGDHHFYISFRTDFAGVRLSNRLREKYPQDMTIILQHQYWDLGVTEHAFEVGLSFSGIPERLLVPFDAVTGFFDPSVQFGLKFEIGGEAEAAPAEPPARPATRGAASEPAEAPPKKPVVPVTGKSAPKLAAKPPGDKPARPEKADKGKAEPADKTDPVPGAEVVSLDAFRKKS